MGLDLPIGLGLDKAGDDVTVERDERGGAGESER